MKTEGSLPGTQGPAIFQDSSF